MHLLHYFSYLHPQYFSPLLLESHSSGFCDSISETPDFVKLEVSYSSFTDIVGEGSTPVLQIWKD